MQEPARPFWIREIVLINAVVFLAFGVAFLLAPRTLAGWLEIEAATPSALADLRAMYGGLPLAVGVFFVLGLREPGWLAPALFATAACSGGLAVARVYSIFASGVPSTLIFVFLALEIASLAWATVAYRALHPGLARSAAATPTS
jgi:hypothetical protein